MLLRLRLRFEKGGSNWYGHWLWLSESGRLSHPQDMNKVLWALQILLALVFLAHGLMLLVPPASIADQMNASMSREFQVFLGVAEILAAVGLTLPGLIGILPWWTQWAAVGIMIVMIAATVFHITRNEISSAATTLVLLAMAAYVAYMRWKVMPIVGRSEPLRS
jgi:uncharacterized membrane protein YphA (DoxX/SURF4 family)